MRDHGATVRLGRGGGGWGAPVVTKCLGGGGGGTRHFFFLNLYNFKNIGGGGMCPPCTPTLRSLSACSQYEYCSRSSC